MRRLILSISLVILIIPVFIPPASGYHIAGSYKSINGQTVPFSTYEGKPLMIEAIQTTCGACRDPEHRGRMNEIASQFSNDLTFVMLSIKTDDTISTLEDFRDEFSINWVMGLDVDHELSLQFSVRYTPSTIIVDETGEQLHFWEGGQDLDTYLGALNALVESSVSFEDTFKAGGDPQGPSLIEVFFSNPLVQAGLIIFILMLIYVKSTSGGTPVEEAENISKSEI